MNTDATAHYTRGPSTAASHFMSSLIECNPFQALLGSKQVQTRSPWQLYSTDENVVSPWQPSLQHPVFDSSTWTGSQTSLTASTAPSFQQAWKWYTAGTGLMLPSPTAAAAASGINDVTNCVSQTNKSTTECSPQKGGLRTGTGSDLCVSGWYGGSNGALASWPTPDADCSSYYQQQQQQQSNYDRLTYNSSTAPSCGNQQYVGLHSNGNQLVEATVSSANNNGFTAPQRQTTVALSASPSVDAVTAAMARYINDRWYSAATGYGSVFAGSAGVSGTGEDAWLHQHHSSVSPHIISAALGVDTKPEVMRSASISGNIDLHLPSVTGSGIRPVGMFVSPQSGLDTFTPAGHGPWTWNPSAVGTANSSYLPSSCNHSVAAASGSASIHHSPVLKLSGYDSTTSSKPYNAEFSGFTSSSSSAAVYTRTDCDVLPVPEMAGVNAAASNQLSAADKLPTKLKKDRNSDVNLASGKPSQRAARQHAPHGTSGGSSNVGGPRSTAAACECPNCREAEQIGGVAGDQLRRLGQHSCHVPGCGKVYNKTSHLKAHLHWHNAGSNIMPTTTSVNSSSSKMVATGSSTTRSAESLLCVRPTCQQHFSRLEDLQRHLAEHVVTTVSPSDGKIPSSLKGNKPISGSDLVTDVGDIISTSKNRLKDNRTGSRTEKASRVSAGSSFGAALSSSKSTPKKATVKRCTSPDSAIENNDVMAKRKRSTETAVAACVDAADSDAPNDISS